MTGVAVMKRGRRVAVAGGEAEVGATLAFPPRPRPRPPSTHAKTMARTR
jgi:hypothetical protein